MPETLTSIAPEIREKAFPQPVHITESDREALFSRGEKEHSEFLRVIGNSNEFGVVVGSGQNTQRWGERGWLTLDISPEHNPSYVCDAHHLESQIPPESLDYVFAENIAFDTTSEKGVTPGRLLQQANVVLKPGGKLIIESAYFYPGTKNQLPDRNKFINQMTEHGFFTVVETKEITGGYKGKGIAQKVIYYGEKKAPGFDESRVT
jgi:predicted SAM-dependent methyltransferase